MRKLTGGKLDTALTSLRRGADGLAWVRLSGGGRSVALWMDATSAWLQVFTGDALEPAARRTALAVEPMTCPPNAFASGENLIVLGPREAVTWRWGIKVLGD
jgi:aldose 1-epimerase